ncbi:MAG: NUDIX domain-containing protein [Deltaproteobacteria bacterium]|nr:NUDIX domain-containing protein [Deltaproteobacteria bacterium]
MDLEVRHAATVILLRDGPDGLETLMLRRDSRLDFAGGHWVFPGGRIDEADRDPARPDDELATAERAAIRETVEEAGLHVRPGDMVAFSHWTPPAMAAKRYLTWFFLAAAPDGVVEIDQHEIREHQWMTPQSALLRRNAGEIELSPPTWITLEQLAVYVSVEDALAQARAASPERFETRIASVPGGIIAVYHGDAAYESGDPDAVGGRHRLWMLGDGWRYERNC